MNKLSKGSYMDEILRSPQSIFSTKDIALLWRENNATTISGRLYKYTKIGKLIRVARGIYAKNNNYNHLELATRIYTPSYVSFETVLTRTGINFQYYEVIFVATYVTREIQVGDIKITFVRINKNILSNTIGIEHVNGYSIATKERAFLDRVYTSKEYHFDNLNVLNWEKVFEILPIYRNKRMEKKVKQYFKYYKKSLS